MKRQSTTQIYTPVTFDNGQRLVQVMSADGRMLGWADGLGKYDRVGTWTIDDAWANSQTLEVARSIKTLKEISTVIVRPHTDNISKVVTSTL